MYYMVRKRKSGEFLKVSPSDNGRSIVLEFDEYNPVYFMTESKLLAEKITDRSCCIEDFLELAGYDIQAPLDVSWSFNDGVMSLRENDLEWVEFYLS